MTLHLLRFDPDVARVAVWFAAEGLTPRDNEDDRMYRLSIASDACRVCALILHVGTPACAALVASPARSE
jgi:hypothetical protein